MKRSLLIIIHLLAVLLAAAGLSVLHWNSPSGYGISWTQKESYAETPQFSGRLNEDIGSIKKLAVLRDAFGENGEVDLDSIVAETEQDGIYTPISLREAVQYAQKFGCYLDPETHAFNISVTEETEALETYELKVTYKYYEPDYFDTVPTGPGIGVTTMKDLSMEIMRELSKYYRLRDKYVDTPGNLYFSTRYLDVRGDYTDFSNTDMSDDEIKALGRFVFVRGEQRQVETNVDPVPENALNAEFDFSPNEDDDEYFFLAAVDTDYPYSDAYRRAADSFEGDVQTAYAAAGMLAAGLLLALISLFMILRYDGFSDREERARAMRLRPADRLPYELYLALCAVLAAAGCFLMMETGLRIARTLAPESQWNYWGKLLNGLVLYGVLIFAVLGTLRREENGGILKNTLVYGLIGDLNRFAADQKTAGSLFLRYGLFVGGNLLLCVCIIWLYLHRMAEDVYLIAFAALVVLLIAADFVIFRKLYEEAKQQDSINDALSRLSGGNADADCELDLSAYTGRERQVAERLNHISTGMRTALSEQVKSERLKADLITNVSHDIRTPLTSIINYVDLLKREEIINPRVREYIEVLDRKSARLKNLTEDLLEASKASSGNVRMEMQRIDLVELSLQAGAEFEDKFAARSLELCLNTPEHPVYISADGRHLWRVLENLYNNAAKYSMEKTRVYADVQEVEGMAVFTIKNVSAAKLNISPDELTERFVRGDISRTTDGSGLGLSIAKSLAALMGGELRIEIDGDLYKASVIFPEYQEPEAEKVEVQKNEARKTENRGDKKEV